MSFALFELAINQEVQDKVREEVLRIKNAHGGKITYEALNEMHYLNRVFNGILLHLNLNYLTNKQTN